LRSHRTSFEGQDQLGEGGAHQDGNTDAEARGIPHDGLWAISDDLPSKRRYHGAVAARALRSFRIEKTSSLIAYGSHSWRKAAPKVTC
jgi:hypothetical protein